MSDGQTAGSSTLGPLEGVRVLELANMWAGPIAGAILSQLGAEVTRIEMPGGGDPMRAWPPRKGGLSLQFARANTNKRSVAIDLRTSEGQALTRRLSTTADVAITSYRLPTLASWGLDYAALAVENRRLIMLSVTGFGKTGPYRERPGFGTIADAMSGYAYVTGTPSTPPLLASFGLSDQVAAVCGALGVMTALYRRKVTGTGDEIDLAIYEPLLFLLGDIVVKYSVTGEIEERRGDVSKVTGARGVYQASDGKWLVISSSAERIAHRLFKAIGREEAITDPRYATNDARIANDAEIRGWLTEWVGSRSRDEALRILIGHDVTAGPVNSAEDIVRDPHFSERSVVQADSADIGSFAMPGFLFHLASFSGRQHVSVPKVGEHTDEVLGGELGIPAGELGRLRELEIIS